eukprot:RCo043252
MLDMGALVWSAFQAVVRVVHPGPSFRPTAKQAEAALSLTRVVFSFVNALLIMAVVPCVVCFFLHVARVRVFFCGGCRCGGLPFVSTPFSCVRLYSSSCCRTLTQALCCTTT